MELPPQYDPKSVEARIYAEWMNRGFFAPNENKIKKSRNQEIKASASNDSKVSSSKIQDSRFTILLPPPNITGSLHIGHALNATISDILIRYHRMKGFATAWLPGIDHAGIAAQNVVEKNLRKENMSRFDLGREKFVEKVWEWKEKYGNIILDQLKRIGASCDWSRTRFTMDPAYSADVLKAFIHYYEQGFIYRGKRLVNWCPRCQTSLSDLEIDYKEEATKLYFIRYPLIIQNDDDKQFIVVATTRPETMLGDAAVAVNPKDKRYKKLIGAMIKLPLTDREIPIIGDDSIDIAFGTGMVKVTPAHDQTDAEIGERHKLAVYEIIDERGRMKNAPEAYAGLKTKEAREKVVTDLQALGLIEKVEDYTHNASTCDRCGTILEPLLSNQWFIRMADDTKARKQESKKASLRDVVLKALKDGDTRVIPENFQKTMTAWLSNVRDWCISRQIWWGHQLPVWFCKNSPLRHSERNEVERRISGDSSASAERNSASLQNDEVFVVALEKPAACPICNNCAMERSADVLDTWFSSALWPFAGLSEEDRAQFYPSNVLITARDIINLWVGRMIFSGLEFVGKTPFADTLIHATILTKDGKRMSKSLGTGIDPLLFIEQYGADATRFGIMWQNLGNQDVRWDDAAVIAGKKFANKLWNAARFVLTRNGISNFQFLISNETPKAQTPADETILAALAKTKKELEKKIAAYELGAGLHDLYDFFWHEFCDVYLEASKAQTDANTDAILLHILTESLKMLHPFMPHITEEIYQKLPGNDNKWLIVESW